MHKLYRGRYPTSLDAHDYRMVKWGDYIRVEENKEDIWLSIFDMQGNRCAYCECEIQSYYKGHVEHFTKRDDNPKLTFYWGNLFGSCRRKDGCGYYKDNQKHTPGMILKVDLDNPDDYFKFLRDGSISVKSGLSVSQMERASETLRVFNLNAAHGPLRQQRSAAIKNQSNVIDEILEYSECNGVDDLLLELIDDFIASIKGLPFETTLRHVIL